MHLKYQAISFEQFDYKAMISSELENGREINALLLVHGFIDSYLREWIFICGKAAKKDFTKKLVREFDRVGFKDLLLMHLFIGNINFLLYQKIHHLNNLRNSIAHDLIQIDYNDKRNREKIRKHVEQDIVLCNEIFMLYKKDLGKKIIEIQQQNN